MHQVISSRTIRCAMLLLIAGAAAVGCSNNVTSTLTPRPHGPTSAPAPTATPTSAASGTMISPQAAATALAGAVAYFNALPHQNLNSDLTTLAAHMVSSGQFSTAKVGYGGITATFSNGATAVLFADTPETLAYPPASPAASTAVHRNAVPANCTASDAPLSDPTLHEVAFLVDECNGVFNVTNATTMENAFINEGLQADGYGVDLQNLTLDNIAALSDHHIDMLTLEGHGNVIVEKDGSNDFIMGSAQVVDAASSATYASDIMASPAPRVAYSVVLAYPFPSSITKPLWAFTPAFVTENLNFNPGSIVFFHSCLSASPAIVNRLTSELALKNVGYYYGWSKSVISVDDDGTESYLIDRLLGEQPPDASNATGLAEIVPQDTPPERPFPLSDVNAALSTTFRRGPLATSNSTTETYDESDGGVDNLVDPPSQDGTIARLVISQPEAAPAPLPLLQSLPSITNMEMLSEGASSGTLGINGTFPAQQGFVVVTDSSGSHQVPIGVWSTTAITATLPSNGQTSAGMVTVEDAGMEIESNPVPLTLWSGQFTYNETDAIINFNGTTGMGSGTFGITANVNVRADVHPVVEAVDATPVPQNLYFEQVTGNSTAAVSTLQGGYGYSNSNGDQTVTFSLIGSPVMAPAMPPLVNGTFELHAPLPGPVGSCNAGVSGPAASGSGTIYCPLFGFRPGQIAQCADTGSTSGCTVPGDWLTSFGVSSGGEGGQLMFVLDPSTYQIAVQTTNGSYSSSTHFGEAGGQGTSTLSGSFGAPLYPPSATTPALRLRAKLRSRSPARR